MAKGTVRLRKSEKPELVPVKVVLRRAGAKVVPVREELAGEKAANLPVVAKGARVDVKVARAGRGGEGLLVA